MSLVFIHAAASSCACCMSCAVGVEGLHSSPVHRQLHIMGWCCMCACVASGEKGELRCLAKFE